MKILGADIGYDEPFWYFKAWEFGLFDQGWLIAHHRIIKIEGRWPTCNTFRWRS